MSRKTVCGFAFVFISWLASAQVTFLIESVPSATPASDTIFICGSFNNWLTNDPRFAVHRQLNGQLTITVNDLTFPLEYKFTRGSWTKVETNLQNQYTPNRTLTAPTSEKIVVNIDNWLDLGGAKKFNFLIFYFFAAAFQGIVLSLLIYRFHKKDNHRFKSLIIINGVLTILFLILIFHEFANQIWQGYFTFAFYVALFLWGPFVLTFVRAFQNNHSFEFKPIYFLPSMVVLLFVLWSFFNPGHFEILASLVVPPFTRADILFLGSGFLFNLAVHVKIAVELKWFHALSGPDLRNKLVLYFFVSSAFALILIPLTFTLSRTHHPFFYNFHGIPIVFSLVLVIQTYYLWRYPNILKEEKTSSVSTEDSQSWIDRVNQVMIESKAFTNADLSVSDFAELLGTKSHILSRMINDTYHKNFRDFVNAYRIEEFIRLANTKEFKHYTFLALAQEVGFNSKSTFNLAFKKYTNKSPREYFKSKEVSG